MSKLVFRAVNLLPDPEATHILVGEFTDDHAEATEKDQNGVVDVKAVYTKGKLVCMSFTDSDLILKWPLCNIFQIGSVHRPHVGSNPK